MSLSATCEYDGLYGTPLSSPGSSSMPLITVSMSYLLELYP